VSNLTHSTHSSTTTKKHNVPEVMMSDVVIAPKPPKPKKSQAVVSQPRESKLGDPGKPKVLKKKYGPGVKSRPLSQMRKLCQSMLGPVRNNVTIVSPLSKTMKDLMPQHDAGSEAFPWAVRDLFEHGEPLYCGVMDFVVKCSNSIVAKFRGTDFENDLLSKEMKTLQYLEEHAPDVPAPRVHGMIAIGGTRVLFMTYFPAMTLEKAWRALDGAQKLQVQEQLDGIMSNLRQCKQAPGLPFGAVDGSGVSEIRFMDIRQATDPITTEEELDNFTFPLYPQAGPNYVEIFRRLLPISNSGSVLTHGDFRPANIIVDFKGDECRVTGIIDWEMAGFYPEFYEANRLANLLLPDWKSDWFLHLPKCISPAATLVRWLFDRLWDYHIRHHMIYIRYLDIHGEPCDPPQERRYIDAPS
jgi:aminoglycoside phosphotransferase